MLSRQEWQERAQQLSWQTQAFIGGRYVDAASGQRFSAINPATGKALAEVAECDAEDVDRAVKAARRAFESEQWSRMAPKDRKKRLLRLAELIEARREDLALTESLDMGKPVRDAYNIDIPNSANAIAWYAEAIDKLYDQVAPTPDNVLATITREPMGVVAAVVPWNFPLMMASWKLGPALAAGNSVILKPAEQSPLSALQLGELAMEAGIPEGVLNVLPGYGETAGQALGLHPDVDCVAFTGSAPVGKLFLGYAARSNMKRVWLECGGKTPHIVFPDATDLYRAAKVAAAGIMFNQGEVCNAGSRLLVADSIREEFVGHVVEAAKGFEPGDPLDPDSPMGAIVDQSQMERVLGYISKGREEGATLRLGGERARTETGGFYVQPTVFDGVRNDMTIAREEIFGPVLSVIGYDDEAEAIRLANESEYGLAAALWTRDVSRAHRVARRLRAGSVWINCFDGGDITTPFGGYKQSGTGRDKSLLALEKYTEVKTTWLELE